MERNKRNFWGQFWIGVVLMIALWLVVPNTYTIGVVCRLCGLLGIQGGAVYGNRMVRHLSVGFLIVEVGGGALFLFYFAH